MLDIYEAWGVVELMFVYPPILVEQWRPISLHTNTWIVHSATECVPSKMQMSSARSTAATR